jgi:hypothetical protein
LNATARARARDGRPFVFRRRMGGPSGRERTMKKSSFSEEQVAFALREVENGQPPVDLPRRGLWSGGDRRGPSPTDSRAVADER